MTVRPWETVDDPYIYTIKCLYWARWYEKEKERKKKEKRNPFQLL